MVEPDDVVNFGNVCVCEMIFGFRLIPLDKDP